jgi:phosphatidylserine synthase
LARFNIDTRDKKYFWGLATPAGAMMVAGYLWAQDTGRDLGFGVAEFPLIVVLLPLFLIFAFHLPVKLPGLKSPKKVIVIPLVIGIVVVIGLLTIGPISITLGLLAYYLLGVFNLFFKFY